MQRVQTFRRFGEPFTSARTFWMLGFQRRGVRMCECDTDMPKLGLRPQTSQVAAMGPEMIATPGPPHKRRDLPKPSQAAARMAPVTQTLGAPELRRAVSLALEGLRAQRAQIDDANVFPVPDGDTGTNMVLTMEAVNESLDGVPDRPADVARAITRGSLMGAKGNSGVILAQYFRGLCEAVDGEGAGPHELVEGLKRATELAYGAMTKPREGTMLTVARAAAETSRGPRTVAAIFEAAAAGAREALERTPDQLPDLKRAGVVDAGGIGLCVILDAFAASLSGRQATPVAATPPGGARTVRPREMGSAGFAYEVQYLLDAPDGAAARIRDRLTAIGDSIAVVGGNGLWNVHVHTNDVGHAIEIGLEHGRPHSVSVVAFEDQIAETRGLPVAVAATPVAVVAIVSGEGLRSVFEELGALVVGDGSMLLDAIEAAPAPDVIVLPNGEWSLADAGAAAERARRIAEVLDTVDLAQGFVAMLAFADSRDLVDNLTEMRAALGRTRTARIAVDEPQPVRALVETAAALGGGEVLMVFAGEGVGDAERAAAERALVEAFPALTVEFRDGGQAGDRYLLTLE